MSSAVLHTCATVVVALLVFVNVSCAPVRPENAHFEAEQAVDRIQRRSPGLQHLQTVKNDTTSCNKSADTDNSTMMCTTNGGVAWSVRNFIDSNSPVIYRALIVLGSISAIVLIYITFRYCRQQWQKSKTRKYGLITMPDDKLELKPLEEDDDDDEDMTVFDRTKPRSMNSQTVPLKKTAKQFCHDLGSLPMAVWPPNA